MGGERCSRLRAVVAHRPAHTTFRTFVMSRATRSSAPLALALGVCLLGTSVLAFAVSGSRAATARTSGPEAAQSAASPDRATPSLAGADPTGDPDDAGERSASPTAIRLPLASNAAPGPAIVRERATVVGRVHDRLGRAVRGAHVLLRPAYGGGFGFDTPLRPELLVELVDGTFRLDAPAGTYELLVNGFAPGSDWLAPWGQERAAFAPEDPRAVPGRFARRIELEQGGTASVDLLVVHAATLEGRVVGPDGQPVERARVRLVSSEIEGFVRDATTDRDGRYRFDRLHPGPLVAHVDLKRVRELSACLPPEPRALVVEEGRAHVLAPLALRSGELARVGGAGPDPRR